MREMFIVQHVHSLRKGHEDVKLIGVYSSAALAQESIVRLQQLPGFAEHPDGFTVDRYILDRDYWAEGFTGL